MALKLIPLHLQVFLSIERRLGHAQAGVLCHERIWGEMVPVGDHPAGGADPHQEGQREPPPTPPSQIISESQPLAEPWFIVALFPQKMQKDRCASEKLLLIGEMQSREWLLLSAELRPAVATAVKFLCVLCFNADTEDMDNERRETMEADVAGLHQFFSKHLEIPGHKDLLTLFSQVLQSDPGSHFPAFFQKK